MPLLLPGGEWIGFDGTPHVGPSEHAGSIPAASTFIGLRPETQPEKLRPPTDLREWVPGAPYPCGGHEALTMKKCIGTMQRGVLEFWFEGTLYCTFKCNKCGRKATDWKEK